jgi:hypothetical protein
MILWMLVFTPALTAQTKVKLMVFGGSDHKVYLGCLSCDPSERDSIFNRAGPYGHCPIFGDTLFCRGPFKSFGTTGPFQNLSACALGALNPPVIVDESGNYYGRFSVGGPFGHGDSVCAIIGRFKHDDACDLVRWVCEQAR